MTSPDTALRDQRRYIISAMEADATVLAAQIQHLESDGYRIVDNGQADGWDEVTGRCEEGP